ncbi:hypothetical protein NC652_041228 [Populus alba x Populus x berolinensis]|nr:hypothetical protein NC652_041228 [Populus alba x Populus x berolinensis]
MTSVFRAGKTWVLIATDVLGRGMDFKGVKCVINYDFPDWLRGSILAPGYAQKEVEEALSTKRINLNKTKRSGRMKQY